MTKLRVTFWNSAKAPKNKMLLPYILDLVWVKTICRVSCGNQHVWKTFCLQFAMIIIHCPVKWQATVSVKTGTDFFLRHRIQPRRGTYLAAYPVHKYGTFSLGETSAEQTCELFSFRVKFTNAWWLESAFHAQFLSWFLNTRATSILILSTKFKISHNVNMRNFHYLINK